MTAAFSPVCCHLDWFNFVLLIVRKKLIENKYERGQKMFENIIKMFSVASQGWWFYIYSRVKLQPFKDYARHHLAWKIEGHFSDVVFRSQKILTKELTLKLWASFIQIHVTKQRWIYQKQPLRGILKWCPEHLRDHPFSTCAKFSEKLTLLTPWYTHVRVRIWG